MRDDVVSSTIQLISESSSQHSYIVQEMWGALSQDTAQRQPLTQVATWCIGEFGDLLLNPQETTPGQSPLSEEEVESFL